MTGRRFPADDPRHTPRVVVGIFGHDAVRIRHGDGRVEGSIANSRDVSEGVPHRDRIARPPMERRRPRHLRKCPYEASGMSPLHAPPRATSAMLDDLAFTHSKSTAEQSLLCLCYYVNKLALTLPSQRPHIGDNPSKPCQ